MSDSEIDDGRAIGVKIISPGVELVEIFGAPRPEDIPMGTYPVQCDKCRKPAPILVDGKCNFCRVIMGK